MLSEVAILLSTHRARRPKLNKVVSYYMVTKFSVLIYLVMHIGDVPLQVSLEIAAVATVGAFKILHLDLREGGMIIITAET